MATKFRDQAKFMATNRPSRKIEFPTDHEGRPQTIAQYFGMNVFDIQRAEGIPLNIKEELTHVAKSGSNIKPEHASLVAKEVTKWATERGATHFCHWFQPLTGSTAEKHDAFLSFTSDGIPLEELSEAQLMQGEPDASSFPHGGSRSTFEARGYTTWDLTSPMFLKEGTNGKTLCIPTAFVSYNGDALDIKTPLLRSVAKLSKEATKFLNLIGQKDVKSVKSTCGAEQEYFLIDKAFYYHRPDLVMSQKTLFGEITSRNQQLEDHYFGTIPQRVLSFMEELDLELLKLGIPAKTRHNEVAPGQFEIAPIFREANVASDHNQLIMAMIKEVAERHDFVALLHEKPFAGINGSGKHVNWSMSTDTGENLLKPGDQPENNHRFLAMVSVIIAAVYRHAEVMRSSISSHGNDHRLGANEAPPSIISVFVGETLEKIFDSIAKGDSFVSADQKFLDVGAEQLAQLLKDNTDRNRTSPFAFTGNRFEFRAVGSNQSIGLPVSVLNGAVASVLEEANTLIEKDLKSGKNAEQTLLGLTKKYLQEASKVIFNGDGYGEAWVQEAAKRGLPNLPNTAEALDVLIDPKKSAFLVEQGIYRPTELQTRYNVLLERYINHRLIEFKALLGMIYQHVIPASLKYKAELANVIQLQKQVGIESGMEKDLLKKVNFELEGLYSKANNFSHALDKAEEATDQAKLAKSFASEFLTQSEEMGNHCNFLEAIVARQHWTLPKYYDMLFVR